MILIKVWYRFTGLMLKWLYRIVFHGDFVYGKRFHMRRAFQLTIENGGRVVLGDDVFFNDFCALHARKSITIGDGTIFGENVRIYDHNHRFADPTTPIKDQGYSEAAVSIGKHCWIGSSVTILKGVTIGDNVVVGAGCVVVKDGRIVTEGYHERCGEYHAERNALTKCSEDLTGATMYVTLEPCCHQGKTPPCTDIILERGIGKVYVGSMDPNPKVAGKGVQILRDHGVEVETGLLEEECLSLNEIFFHYITTKMPYVAMKYAMTLDGKIASFSGDSKWVTGEKAREHTHFLRKKYRGILVGIGTVLADDPMLNCRIENGVDPVRIVCDSHLQIPLECQLVKTAKDIDTIVCYAEENEEKKKALMEAGVQLIKAEKDGQVDLEKLMMELGSMEIDSVLVEGGGAIHGSFLTSGLVQKVYCYIAPKMIGGKDALSPVLGKGIEKMSDAVEITDVTVQNFGSDICVSGHVKQKKEG